MTKRLSIPHKLADLIAFFDFVAFLQIRTKNMLNHDIGLYAVIFYYRIKETFSMEVFK